MRQIMRHSSAALPFAATPNGRRISVALEKMGLPRTVHPVNIVKGERFDRPL
jgi:glutathione S-transferase